MNISRNNAFRAILQERAYQDEKWGGVLDHPHSVGGYLTLLRVKLARAEKAWAGKKGDRAAMEEVRKIAALAVACMEQHEAKFRDDKPRPELPSDQDWASYR